MPSATIQYHSSSLLLPRLSVQPCGQDVRRKICVFFAVCVEFSLLLRCRLMSQCWHSRIAPVCRKTTTLLFHAPSKHLSSSPTCLCVYFYILLSSVGSFTLWDWSDLELSRLRLPSAYIHPTTHEHAQTCSENGMDMFISYTVWSFRLICKPIEF